MLKDNVNSTHPGLISIPCSFGMTKGIDGVPWCDIADVVSGAGGNCDSIIESNEGAGPVDESLVVRAVGDAVATKAALDMHAVTRNVTTVVEAAAAGGAGDEWSITLIAGAAAKAGLANEDTVNKVFTFMFQDGVSDVDDFETVVTAAANLAVKAGGTGAALLDAADDTSYGSALGGGIDQEYVDDDGQKVTMHFEPTATTVAELETAIAAYAAAGGRIKTQTTGTGASVLNADDAFGYRPLEDGYASEVVGWGIKDIQRTAVGTYLLTLVDRFAKCIDKEAALQLATADDKKVQLGDYTQADGTLEIFTWDISGGALADIATAAGNRIHLELVMQQ